MKVPKSQKPRYGRGNLAEAQAALRSGNALVGVKAINEHARNRVKAAGFRVGVK